MSEETEHGWQILPLHNTDVSPNYRQDLSALDLQHDRHQNEATQDEIDLFVATHLPTIAHIELTMPYVGSSAKLRIKLWLNWETRDTALPNVALTVSYKNSLYALKRIIACQNAGNLWSPILEQMTREVKQMVLANRKPSRVDFVLQITTNDLPALMREKALERMKWMQLLASCYRDGFPESNISDYNVVVNPSDSRYLGISLPANVALQWVGDFAFVTEYCVCYWHKNSKMILLCYFESMNENLANALNCADEWQVFQIENQNHQKAGNTYRETKQSEQQAFYAEKIDEAFAL